MIDRVKNVLGKDGRNLMLPRLENVEYTICLGNVKRMKKMMEKRTEKKFLDLYILPSECFE